MIINEVRITEFEWDENKNRINIKKHGISFKYAARVFDDEHYFEQYDEYHSDDEDR
ncbi:MAG: BrnT family toxin, partial [Selenomonadaceae bacterium]|nr:BrnT family toxin [Selenomonadaceae bacterium]